MSRVVVYYMANHVRGQISTRGWGDMLRNATFCFAHQTQPTSHNEEARTKTPYTRFTAAKSILDAMRVPGFAGELCWHILPGRKLSQLRGQAAPVQRRVRPSGQPALGARPLVPQVCPLP